VPYKVNGTARVAIRGEDSLNWTFSWIELLVRDPLALEFPEGGGGVHAAQLDDGVRRP